MEAVLESLTIFDGNGRQPLYPIIAYLLFILILLLNGAYPIELETKLMSAERFTLCFAF